MKYKIKNVDRSVQMAYEKFLDDLEMSIKNKRQEAVNTLSNIFSMRVLGNKTHGDLAEVALTEFVNKFIHGYEAKHVGKENFRSKKSEEDILVKSPDGILFSISLKAYGVGPLQLSTNKDSSMFNVLVEHIGERSTEEMDVIESVLKEDAFIGFLRSVDVLPFIYDEKNMKCNIMIFNLNKAFDSVKRIEYLIKGKGRKHPVYRFLGDNDQYLFEVRYGGTGANALQRGLWTHTKNAQPYFRSLTGGWVDYTINKKLLRLIALCLINSESTHEAILRILDKS